MSNVFDHDDLRDLLPRYAANALGADERRRVQQHLAGCAACRAALGEWDAITAALRGDAATLPADVPPAQAWTALHARLALVPVLNHQKGTDMDEPIVASEITNQPIRHPASSAAAKPRRWLGAVSVAIVALIVVISVALFGALHRAGSNPATTNAPSANCIGAKTTATLPQYTTLLSISQVSPTDIWASGVRFDAQGKATSAIYHLVNCQWRDMHVTLPQISLDSIAMVSSNEGWVAGSRFITGPCNCVGTQTGLVLLHYLHGQWQQTTVPGASAFIDGTLSFRSPDEGWLVANGAGSQLDNALFHYVAGTWQRVSLPTAIAQGVSSPITVVGPNDIWFTSFLTLDSISQASTGDIVHWQNGHSTTYPLPRNSFASSLSFPAPNDGWMTGSTHTDFNDTMPAQPLLWHFDGMQWTNVVLPTFVPPMIPNPTYFTSGSFATEQAGVAFGYTLDYAKASEPLIIYQYQNGQWHTLPGPHVPFLMHASGGQILMVSPDEGWALAVGYQADGRYVMRPTVILHYANGAWSVFEQ
jgi:hypothetical protein